MSELVSCTRGGERLEFTRLVPPARLPELRPYSPRSPFNRRIGRRHRVDPRSGRMVAGLVREADSAGASLTWRRWTVPVYFSGARSRRRRVPLKAPWRAARAIERVPMPAVAAPDPAGDGHLAVVDARSGCEYDFYELRRRRGRFSAQWGAALPVGGTGVYPRGLSARGSGFALLAGLVWPHELARGRIDHALIFSYPDPKAGGPVAPATESDGPSRRPGAIPEGARIQLDPDLDLDALGLQGYERTVARALQEYGAYLADVGGRGLTFYAIHPMSTRTNPYAGLLPDVTYPPLSNIPFERLRVLRHGRQRQQRFRLPRNRCARFDPLRR